MSHRHESPRTNKIVFDSRLVQLIVKLIRDMAIFVLGGYAFLHELGRTGAERPQILIMSAAMMGLPLVMRGDERRQEGKSKDDAPK